MNDHKKKIVAVFEGISSESNILLKKYFEVVEFKSIKDDAYLNYGNKEDIFGIFIKLKHFIDDVFLSRLKKLRFIATPTTGLNHINLNYCNAKSIEIVSLKGERTFLRDVRATSEFTWGLILSLLRNIPSAYEHSKSGRWERNNFLGTELYGKTIGILGYGRLGRIIEKYARSFGMDILINDLKLYKKSNFVPVSELFRKSDIVTIHIDLRPENINFVDTHKLSLMKKSAILINTSRGEVINELDLKYHLEKNNIAGCAIDVINNEYSATENILLELSKSNPNIIITPHIAGNTVDSRQKTDMFICKKVINKIKSINF